MSLLKICHTIWSRYDNLPKLVRISLAQPQSMFFLAKILSIEETVRRGIALEMTNPPKSFGINPLVVNIMEAVLEDERNRNFDNAEAGIILAKFPHTKEYNNKTGSGPCHLSRNLQVLECPQPLTRHWADLYSTWNLAFVSAFPDFVYYLPKLLIPSVSDYQGNPAGYIN